MNSFLQNIAIGSKSPSIVHAIIEIPKGSHNKYEFDQSQGVFVLDRVLYSPFHYPLDYGFIPETHSEDGDHLDIMVLGSDPVFTGCLVEVRPVGLLKMVDSGDRDFKIIGVQEKNPRFAKIRDIKDIESFNDHLLREVSHFFKVYKDLQGKKVDIMGWEGAKHAEKEILNAHKSYKKLSKKG